MTTLTISGGTPEQMEECFRRFDEEHRKKGRKVQKQPQSKTLKDVRENESFIRV